jgi:hypothetical protein
LITWRSTTDDSVKDGAVVNQSEYAEMEEFASAAERQLAELPVQPCDAESKTGVAALRASIGRKAGPAEVGEQAHALAAALPPTRCRWRRPSCLTCSAARSYTETTVPLAMACPALLTARLRRS